MRFMEWSKSNLPVRFAALALVFAFAASLGVVALPSEAEAGRRNVWSVKFKCSVDSGALYDEKLEHIPYIGATVDVVVQTWVNIHNPTDRTVDFNKKVVIVEPQHANATTKVSPKDGITLSANKAHSIDCKDIVKILAVDLGTPVIDPREFVVGDKDTAKEGIFEGFVVIESEKGRKIPVLAVCANYSAYAFDDTDADTIATAVDLECFKPIRVRFEGDFKLF